MDVPAEFGGDGDRAGSVQGLSCALVHDQADRKLDRAEVVVASRGFGREAVEPLDGERFLLEAGPGGHAVAAEVACVHALFEHRERGPQARGEVFLLALGIVDEHQLGVPAEFGAAAVGLPAHVLRVEAVAGLGVRDDAGGVGAPRRGPGEEAGLRRDGDVWVLGEYGCQEPVGAAVGIVRGVSIQPPGELAARRAAAASSSPETRYVPRARAAVTGRLRARWPLGRRPVR